MPGRLILANNSVLQVLTFLYTLFLGLMSFYIRTIQMVLGWDEVSIFYEVYVFLNVEV